MLISPERTDMMHHVLGVIFMDCGIILSQDLDSKCLVS